MDWGRWESKQADLWGLSDGEARVLSVLSKHVNRDGLVTVKFLTHAEIGRRAARKGKHRSERTVRRLLAQLRDRGLVSWTQRGRDVPVYQLHDVLPFEQPSLDGFDRPKMAGRPTGQPAKAVTGHPGQIDGRQGSKEEVVVVVGAHAPDADSQNSNGGRVVGVLHPKLDEVLEIFRALPDPYRHVEPASIDAALRAYPDQDVVAAAHIVASKVHGGQAYTSHVNTLLLGVLRRMPTNVAEPAPATPSGGGRPAAGRPARKPKPWDGALQRAIEASA